MKVLLIKELTFSAAHYIPKHEKCGAIHGHTFFVRNIRIECSQFVDFAIIKETIMRYDHKFLVPRTEYLIWLQMVERLFENKVDAFRFDLVPIEGEPTVEDISEQLQNELRRIKGIDNCTFELYEGPNQGVRV